MDNKDIMRELARLDIAADDCGNLETDRREKLTTIAHFVIQTVIKAKLMDFELPRELKVTVQKIDYVTGTETPCLIHPEFKNYIFASDHICHLNHPIVNTKIDFFMKLIDEGWLDELTKFIQERTAAKSSKLDEIYETLKVPSEIELPKQKTFWERIFQ